jgi:hypothetical protein
MNDIDAKAKTEWKENSAIIKLEIGSEGNEFNQGSQEK